MPAIFKDVVPKVQTRAATVGLSLPSWADTSAYWRDGVRDKAKALAATCPSPTPLASLISALGDFANYSQMR